MCFLFMCLDVNEAKVLREWSDISLFATLCIFVVISIIGTIDSKYIHYNERFSIKSMAFVCTYIIDFITDLLFAIQIWFTSKYAIANEDIISLNILFGLSIFFILFPMIINLFQLQHSIQKWTIPSMCCIDRNSASHSHLD